MTHEPVSIRRFGGKVEAAFDYKKKKDRREWLRVRLKPGAESGLWRAEKYPRDGAGRC